MSLDVFVATETGALQRADTIEMGDDAEDVVLGRTVGSRIHVPDARISGTHAIFRRTAGAIELVERSTNGTFKNNTRLKKDQTTRLADGDVVSALIPMKRVPAGTKACVQLLDFVLALKLVHEIQADFFEQLGGDKPRHY